MLQMDFRSLADSLAEVDSFAVADNFAADYVERLGEHYLADIPAEVVHIADCLEDFWNPNYYFEGIAG